MVYQPDECNEDLVEAAILAGELVKDDDNDWPDDELELEPVKLRLLDQPTLADTPPAKYTPEWTTKQRWKALSGRYKGGKRKLVSQPVQCVELLDANWWPVSHDGSIYALPRRQDDIPSGGILSPPGKGWLDEVSAIYRAYTGRHLVLSSTARRDAYSAWAGKPTPVTGDPYTRWGRADDGALWWDSGQESGAVIRVDSTGWTIESEPGCWFIRPRTLAALRLPVPGAPIDELWEHIRIPEADRRLVLAWLLASMLPGLSTAAGMLFLDGEPASGKSTAMSRLTAAAGGEANRQAKGGGGGSDKDLFAVAADGWVLGIDNISSWSRAESDHLCRLISGTTSSSRKLYTDLTTVRIRVRRPVIATTTGVAVLHDDLVRRMIPVTGLRKVASPRPDHTLTVAWHAAQPGVFGSLLDLMVQVMALGNPPEDAVLSTLPSWGWMAWALDELLGPEADGVTTVARCLERQAGMKSNSIHDDPFWLAAGRALDARGFTGTAAAFIQRVEEDGLRHSFRPLPKTWPSPAGFRARYGGLRADGLRAAGWTVEQVVGRSETGHKPARWHIVPPPKPEPGEDPHGDDCDCDRCHPDF